MTSPTVGFVGLGNIGGPMARRLADWPGGLWVHDVVPDAAAPFVALGAHTADSVGELAEHADVVSVMVRDDDQVRDVVGQLLDTSRPGRTVLIHSTIHPDTARDLAASAADRDVAVLDAPVSGGAMGAADGTLAILVGGEPAAFEVARPVLERLGSLVVHLGPASAGTQAKLARNLLHFVAFTAVTEAQRLAEAAGIDLVTLGNVVRHTDAITGGPGAIMHRDTAAPVAADNPWRPILEHVRDLGEKDLRLAIELGDAFGVDTPLAELSLQLLADGLGLVTEETS